ncbi:MAG: hypothetical protein ACRDN0_04395, partial [Trebonia sp.]
MTALLSAVLLAGCSGSNGTGGSSNGRGSSSAGAGTTASAGTTAHATVTISPAKQYQRIAGFGVSEG